MGEFRTGKGLAMLNTPASYPAVGHLVYRVYFAWQGALDGLLRAWFT